MDAIVHFHMRLDSNINSPRDLKCFNLQFFFYHCIPLQVKNFVMLNYNKPVTLAINAETFTSFTLNRKNYNDLKNGVFARKLQYLR